MLKEIHLVIDLILIKTNFNANSPKALGNPENSSDEHSKPCNKSTTPLLSNDVSLDLHRNTVKMYPSSVVTSCSSASYPNNSIS